MFTFRLLITVNNNEKKHKEEMVAINNISVVCNKLSSCPVKTLSLG